MLRKNINFCLVTIGVFFCCSHLWLNTDTTFSCSSTKAFQRLPLAVQCTREFLVWIYSLSGKICKRAVPDADWGLAGNAFDAAAAGRRVGGRGFAWLCLHGTAIRTECKPADLCWSFPGARQLEKLLGCGGKGSELRAPLRERHWRSHIWTRTFSLLTLPGLRAQICIRHAHAFPLEPFSSKWS